MIIVASVVLGAVFLISGVSKVAAPVRWRVQSGELGVPEPITLVVPFVELLVGAMLVAQIARPAVAIVAAAMLVAFTVLLVLRLSQGRKPPCACFGSLSTKPIGWVDVARNAAFVAIALAIAGAR